MRIIAAPDPSNIGQMMATVEDITAEKQRRSEAEAQRDGISSAAKYDLRFQADHYPRPDNGIWQVIGDFGASGQYLSGVVRCMVEGVGVGARRTLTSTDDSTVVERLETLDEAAHRLSYALLTNMPFRNCLTTMTVHDLGSNQAELVWLAAFEPDGLPAREAAELMAGALAANCAALKQLLERRAEA